jgi:hypothetical protein
LIYRQKVPSASALQLHSFQFDDFGLEEIVTLKVGRTLADSEMHCSDHPQRIMYESGLYYRLCAEICGQILVTY